MLSEIGRILKLDDLSAKIPHFVTSMNNTFHTGIFEDDTPHYDDIKINATSLFVPGLLPSNHDFLLDSFHPVEIKRIMDLLHTNSSLLPSALLPALHAQDFNTLLQFLVSTISQSHKEIFEPYFLPPSTQFELFVSGHPPVVQIRSSQVIKLDPLSHINIVLDLQILNRSTHIALHPHYTGGDIFLCSLSSTSVTAKHEFEAIFTTIIICLNTTSTD